MRLLFTLTFLLGSTSAWAQYYMDVTTKDGERILIPVADVNEVQIVNESDYHKPNGEHNGYEYVDLGLSVMWATCNVGANSPEGTGDMFAWGEVTPKSEYTTANYKFYTNGEANKYVTDSTSIYLDNKTTLDRCDDAARQYMGGGWRTPTQAEVQELLDNCSIVYTTNNGVEGLRIFSKINGNSIFVPRVYNYNGQLSSLYYWTSSLMGVDVGAVGFVNMALGGYYRYTNGSIRAVYTATESTPTKITLSLDANGGSGEMSAISIWSDDNNNTILLPSSIFIRDGYRFSNWNTQADGSGISYLDGDSINLTQDITLYAQWEELSPLDESFYMALDGKTVKFTESVGSYYEASYGALVTLLTVEEIEAAGVVKSGFTAADYIGLKLTYNWYGFGVNCNYCIFINKKDYSVSAPTQIVGDVSADIILNYIFGVDYGPGQFEFDGFIGELDTQTNILLFQHTAYVNVSVGTGGFGTDTYKIEF